MSALHQLYAIALRAYPREFREHHGREMSRLFAEGWRDAGACRPTTRLAYLGRLFADLVVSATRERIAAAERGTVLTGLAVAASGTAVVYVDFHASEVQATLGTLLASNAGLAWAQPRRPWLRAALVGGALPAAHLIRLAILGGPVVEAHPWWSRTLILLPAVTAALAGAYVGASLRRATARRRG